MQNRGYGAGNMKLALNEIGSEIYYRSHGAIIIDEHYTVWELDVKGNDTQYRR